MPASTRSQARQIRIDDATQLKGAVAPSKRKQSEETTKAPKKIRQSTANREGVSGEVDKPALDGPEDSVSINRAPVLELWGASVASFLYKDLPWETCLSIGGAISTICAISKGRAIGAVDKPDPDAVETKRAKRQEQAQSKDLSEVEVMSFTINIKKGAALVSGKAKKANEATLSHKFGELYEQTKTTFVNALSTWKEDEEDLNARAFHMYEDFRPTVPTGQKGWGRKGQLSLQHVQSVVQR